jgi:hypothetical protein
MLEELLDLLNLLNMEIVVSHSDDNYAYHEIIPRNILHTGKKNTQKKSSVNIYRYVLGRNDWQEKHMFLSSRQMHKTIVGLCINVKISNDH